MEYGANEDFPAPGKLSPYFGRGYYHVYRDYLLPPEMTRAEVDFLVRMLRPRRGERWLDMPCGYGRHLAALAEARRDLRLIGGDLNRDYLREAGLRLAAEVAACDMRRLPFADGAFHVVLNMLNSFGYYPPHKTETPLGKCRNLILNLMTAGRQRVQRDRQSTGAAGGDVHSPGAVTPLDDRAVMAEFARVLKPGGRLVLDLSSRRALIALASHPTIRYAGGEHECLERFAWDPKNEVLSNETVWRWPGGRERARYRMRLYTPRQTGKMLDLNGLEVENIFGGFDGRPYDERDSERMLVIARK
jgi:SAM-dependent methyltransferase